MESVEAGSGPPTEPGWRCPTSTSPWCRRTPDRQVRGRRRAARFGGDDGQFQFQPRAAPAPGRRCTPTPTQQTFLSASMNQTVTNFDGDISDAFGCIAALGDKRGAASRGSSRIGALGAGSRQHARRQPGLSARRRVAGGGADNQRRRLLGARRLGSRRFRTRCLMSDPLGPYWSFRCNEFGHLCNINGDCCSRRRAGPPITCRGASRTRRRPAS